MRLLQSSARYTRLMISSCALSAVQAEPLFIIMEGLSAVWGIRREAGGRRQARGRRRRGESKQSWVNFPEGRPRAWLGRGPRDDQSKTAFQPIKRQAVCHLQSEMRLPIKRKETRESERALRKCVQRDPNLYPCTSAERLERL